MKKNYFFKSFILIVSLWAFEINAQSITVGSGTFTGTNVGGPMMTTADAGAHSRYAYIFPSSLFSQIRNGDTISSLSFLRNGNAGKISGSCSLKIYMRNTVNSDYGNGKVFWSTQKNATGMKLVYDNFPMSAIDSSIGWKNFVLDSKYVYDSVFGQNLEILVEYYQSSAQQGSIFWSYENASSISAYNNNNQSKYIRVTNATMPDSTNSSSSNHPTIRIGYPRNAIDASVDMIYSYGKIPVPIGNPDTLKALVRNVGKNAINNLKVIIKSKGANNLMDSALYSFKLAEERLINLPLLFPTNIGIDTIEVFIKKDDDAGNNLKSIVRLATDFVYSYRDVTLPIAGGIGFNGATGQFVAKFYTNSPKAINQISVAFVGRNLPFKLGIWSVDSITGLPKSLIYQSDTLRTNTNFVAPVLPPVKVNGSFFVGVMQLGLVNVGFGYQPENPVRSKTFLYAGLNSNAWTDFAPGAPFKFVIEPRIQAQNDVSPVALIIPKDTIDLTKTKTIAPKVKILNYGANNQTIAFTTRMEVRRNNSLFYASNKQDTLYSGGTKIITFDSTFLPTIAGNYDFLIFTRLSNDQIKDNDTLKKTIVVAKYKDVGLGTIFDPSSGVDYEQFVDTIYPTVFVQNYGLDNVNNFNVRVEIRDSLKNIVYIKTKTFSLLPLNSVLASFDAFPCSVRGKYYFTAYTNFVNDIDRKNDTVRRTFNVIRSFDVGVSSATYPSKNQILTRPLSSKKPEVIVKNFGDANIDDLFKVHCEIYFSDSLIYKDSSTTNSYRNINSNVLFKSFLPTLDGYYKLKSFTSYGLDQLKTNDTLYSNFSVGLPDDISVIAISPSNSDSLTLDYTYKPIVTIKNIGYKAQNTLFPVTFSVFDGQNLVYSNTKNTTIGIGETKQIEFDSTFKINTLGDLKAIAYVGLSLDFVKSNDTLIVNYIAFKQFDLELTSILYPLDTDTLLVGIDEIMPQVSLKNVGSKLITDNFTVSLKIFDNLTNVLLYSKDIDTNFNVSSSLVLAFPKLGIQLIERNIRINAIAFCPNDQIAANDNIIGFSQFLLKNDAELLVINKMVAKVYSDASPDILPEITIKNNGKQTNIVKAYFEIIKKDTINNNDLIVYFDSIQINLLSGETLSSVFNLPFVFSKADFGKYEAKSWVKTSLDQLPLNNEQKLIFYIEKKVSVNNVQLTQIKIYPNPSSGIVLVSGLSENGSVIKIKNSLGQVVLEQTNIKNVTEINTSELSEGVYFLCVENIVVKLVVKKQ